MTGTSYKRSAELAGIVGPYEGYARNADAAQAGHAQARRGQRRDPHRTRRWTRTSSAEATKAWDATHQDRREERLAQRAGLGARTDRHHRLHDGLRHHRHRAGLLAGQVQEAGRRRLDADRQPDGPAGAAQARLPPRRPSRRSSSTSPSTATSSTPRACARSTTRSSTARWASASIAPMGHVRMMAAVQPFLSGAISKTVNMPETATVEEIEDVYFQGWKLGLKALAIYRDNCKVGQPLSDGKAKAATTDEPTVGEGRRVPPDPQAAAEEAPGADDVVRRRRRRGLHDRRRPTRTTVSARSSSRCRSRARPWPA